MDGPGKGFCLLNLTVWKMEAGEENLPDTWEALGPIAKTAKNNKNKMPIEKKIWRGPFDIENNTPRIPDYCFQSIQ